MPKILRARKRQATRALEVLVPGGETVTVEVRLPAGSSAASPFVVLAHGAGAGMHHPFMTFFYESLGSEFPTARFNFLYTELGRRSPDPAPRLKATFRAVIDAVKAEFGVTGETLVLAGKSMGGRIATHLVAEGDEAAAVILLGYPLHPPGRPDRLRKDHLTELRCPLLFIQGTRDALCELSLLHTALAEIQAPVTLHVVEGGDHSLHVMKRSGRTDQEVLAEVREVICKWLASEVPPPPQ